jgi:four helix bundle protein
MQDPKRLKVREAALALSVAIYRLTATFPREERFGLATQMQRAAISVGSNISEGCGAQGDRAMIAYLHHAVGSLHELEFQIEVTAALGYCSEDASAALVTQVRTARRMIIRLLLVLRKRSQRTP